MYFDHLYPVTDLTNTEKNDHQNDTKVRRSTIQDGRILTIVEDQATENAHKKQRLVNNDSAKITLIHSWKLVLQTLNN